MPSRRNDQQREKLRSRVADEAARVMLEQGLTDFRLAKEKALERLGLVRAGGPLPSNGEIEAALASRQRIFHGDSHPEQLMSLRLAALDAMQSLVDFQPRLAGAVLSGNATEHTPIDLHLFTDSPEAVGTRLESLGLMPRSIQVRHQLRRGEPERFPGYRFLADEFECVGTVFPERRRGHPPLSPVDGRPMRRADQRELERLIAGDAPAAG
jgi:hypothetical protein